MEHNTSYYRQRSRILREALDEIDAMATFSGNSAEQMRDEISTTMQKAMVRLEDLRLKFEEPTSQNFEITTEHN